MAFVTDSDPGIEPGDDPDAPPDPFDPSLGIEPGNGVTDPPVYVTPGGGAQVAPPATPEAAATGLSFAGKVACVGGAALVAFIVYKLATRRKRRR